MVPSPSAPTRGPICHRLDNYENGTIAVLLDTEGYGTINYPSGRVAASISKNILRGSKPTPYIQAYENCKTQDVVLSFKPNAIGSVFTDSIPRILCDRYGVKIFDEKGVFMELRRWDMKMKPYELSMNKHLTFRIVNRSDVSLAFSCEGIEVILPLGVPSNADVYSPPPTILPSATYTSSYILGHTKGKFAPRPTSPDGNTSPRSTIRPESAIRMMKEATQRANELLQKNGEFKLVVDTSHMRKKRFCKLPVAREEEIIALCDPPKGTAAADSNRLAMIYCHAQWAPNSRTTMMRLMESLWKKVQEHESLGKSVDFYSHDMTSSFYMRKRFQFEGAPFFVFLYNRRPVRADTKFCENWGLLAEDCLAQLESSLQAGLRGSFLPNNFSVAPMGRDLKIVYDKVDGLFETSHFRQMESRAVSELARQERNKPPTPNSLSMNKHRTRRQETYGNDPFNRTSASAMGGYSAILSATQQLPPQPRRGATRHTPSEYFSETRQHYNFGATM